MTASTVYLVRHGETDWNLKRIIQGQSDSPLTPLGEKQARELSSELRTVSLDAVFSSDLGRAEWTARIIAQAHGLPIQTTPLLRERRFGRYEGQPAAALPRSSDLFAGLSTEERFRIKSSPDVESDEEIVCRLRRFLRHTAPLYAGGTILAVTHGGLMRAFLICIGFGTYENFGHTPIGNAAYVKLLTDGEKLCLAETRGVTQPGEMDAQAQDETVQPPFGG